MQSWKERLEGKVPADLAEQIDTFETQIDLRRQNKIEERVFAETRLRKGVYGQRYDNGKRHDGEKTQQLQFPNAPLTKGPDTHWDAPGMMRIKIPMGRVTAEQLEVMSELAEEYSDGILHVTTRQDIQLHFVHIEDTPNLMRRLAAVGITTHEACGNAVRNVTACPTAGVCNDESFDVTPYANAMTYYLLGHRDAQDFGRKFKIAFSGCAGHACGLANIHDLGLVGTTKQVDGETKRGFAFYVGGGLGSVPHQAKLLAEFVPEDEMLPLAQAVCRVFARLGEKKNRSRARLKFVVAKLGIEEFRKVVDEERAKIPADERWTTYLDDLRSLEDKPLKPGKALDATPADEGFLRWRKTNAAAQAQKGYAVVTVRMPLGDITSSQGRALAAIAREYTGDTMRFTVEQNMVIRWVPEADLPAVYAGLVAAGVGDWGAATVRDITSCPGTDTCKLGISASRGLAGVLTDHLGEIDSRLSDAFKALRIKASGCFNSCGQHHVADIGFLGVSRNVKGRRVAHFQLVVGGQWAGNGASYGLAIGAFPAKSVPALVQEINDYFAAEREADESFHDFVRRIGKAQFRKRFESFKRVPDYEEDPSYYVDWGDAREYTIGDLGVGECAGEVVSIVEFGLADSERTLYKAQADLEAGNADDAAGKAFGAMLEAAKALVKLEYIDVKDAADDIVAEFRSRYHDTKVFHDPFAGAKFANYFLRIHASQGEPVDAEEAHRRIEEAQLFIEAAHSCYDRLQESAA